MKVLTTPIITVLLCLLLIPQVKAQKQKDISNFLLDMGIKDFKINSSIKDLEKKGNLAFLSRLDDESTYLVKTAYSNASINSATLVACNGALKRVAFERIGNLRSGAFERLRTDLISKYGKPLSIPSKDSSENRYEWRHKNLELILRRHTFSFIVIFGEAPAVKHLWIYKDRKGKGKNTVQLNPDSWEKLINSNLTVAAFEKCLPNWQTTGNKNHIQFDLNSKTRKFDIPQFSLIYKLNDCDIEISADTTSKTISSYKFSKIHNPMVIYEIKKELMNSGYKIDKNPKRDNVIFYSNRPKKITIIMSQDDDDFDFYIYRDKY